ncbi:RING-like zinc finger protein [Teratosphaeria destructans]|uniref:RING-type E3 ubiquitin transferase n=1 Tax=Teratosphaeria destructans TaxID=418781 RepID=A0A9W7W0S7_9PEZI|nr:RING-like zinc finger protein [Teratosphaeria destructans]
MADRTNQPPGHRDMVYCHSCENEWYRDEHGLECPECHSDFIEIIEPNHDPRDEPPPLENEHGHADFYGAPDPDEDDIGGIQWRQTGPGQMTGTQHRRFNGTFTYGPDGLQPTGQQGGGLGGGGLLGAIGSMLSGALGGGQQPQQDQRPQSPETDQAERAQSAPGSPRGSSTRVRTFNLPGGRGQFTFATTTMHMGQPGGMPGPRNAHEPQPFTPQPQMIDQMMAQMFANILPGGAAGGHGGLMFGGPGGPFMAGAHGHGGMPFNLIDILGRPLGGPLGDAVFSQEDLDRVITQLMEQHQAGNAPGPASEAAIRALPTRSVSKDDLDEKTGKAECSICMDEVQVGTTITELPCHHWFHGECIKAWLGEHDTCPHCRQGIMPREGDGSNAQRPRESSQAPLNNMHSPEHQAPRSMPGGFPGLNRQESGSRQHPYTVPDSPGMERRTSASGAAERGSSRQAGAGGSSAGGLLGRMREAFSPGSSGDAGTRGDDAGTKR